MSFISAANIDETQANNKLLLQRIDACKKLSGLANLAQSLPERIEVAYQVANGMFDKTFSDHSCDKKPSLNIGDDFMTASQKFDDLTTTLEMYTCLPPSRKARGYKRNALIEQFDGLSEEFLQIARDAIRIDSEALANEVNDRLGVIHTTLGR